MIQEVGGLLMELVAVHIILTGPDTVGQVLLQWIESSHRVPIYELWSCSWRPDQKIQVLWWWWRWWSLFLPLELTPQPNFVRALMVTNWCSTILLLPKINLSFTFDNSISPYNAKFQTCWKMRTLHLDTWPPSSTLSPTHIAVDIAPLSNILHSA